MSNREINSHFASIAMNDKSSTLLNWVTIFDRLIICAHGSSDSLAHLSPRKLADLLYNWGLRRVGLITFKACNVATGDFFDLLIRACERKSIQVGYLKGYMGSSATVWNENGVKEIVTYKTTGPSGSNRTPWPVTTAYTSRAAATEGQWGCPRPFRWRISQRSRRSPGREILIESAPVAIDELQTLIGDPGAVIVGRAPGVCRGWRSPAVSLSAITLGRCERFTQPGFSCHWEEPSDAAISSAAHNRMGIASLREHQARFALGATFIVMAGPSRPSVVALCRYRWPEQARP